MKNYRVYPTQDDENFYWNVYENVTGQIVSSFWFEEDAIEYAKNLEKGAGFAGFTPAFILRKVSLSKDINTAFSEEFA